MADITMEMEGDVHVIKNVTGTKQLREFYNQVVKNNWEKYVGITTQGIRYGFSSEKNSAVRLADSEMFAINPNYRSSKVTKEEAEAVKAETVATEEAKTMQAEQPKQEEIKPATVESQPAVIAHDVDYKSLYTQQQNKNKQIEQSLVALQNQLKVQTERANYAEKEVTKLMESKVANEGNITKLEETIRDKENQLATMSSELESAKKEGGAEVSYEALTTDELVNLLVGKGYKVTVSK